MMAASKPTSSLSVQPHILSTERHLGTLAAGLACLPLAREAYPSRTDSRVTPCGIRSLIEFGTLVWALVHPVLYLRRSAHEASPHQLAPALTPCKHIISGTISLLSQRFFSPFPRGTCSLSVANEYLGLRRGRRRFIRSFTCIVLLRKSLGVLGFLVTGLSPSMAQLSRSFT